MYCAHSMTIKIACVPYKPMVKDVSDASSTPWRVNLENLITEVSLGKRIKCFLSMLCLRKTRTGTKSFSKSSVFRMVYLHTEIQKQCSKFLRFEERFAKSSVFMTDLMWTIMSQNVEIMPHFQISPP